MTSALNLQSFSTVLKKHNHVIRECLKEYKGYEVKTIGKVTPYPTPGTDFS